jgi:hypothetical protein
VIREKESGVKKRISKIDSYNEYYFDIKKVKK